METDYEGNSAVIILALSKSITYIRVSLCILFLLLGWSPYTEELKHGFIICVCLILIKNPYPLEIRLTINSLLRGLKEPRASLPAKQADKKLSWTILLAFVLCIYKGKILSSQSWLLSLPINVM